MLHPHKSLQVPTSHILYLNSRQIFGYLNPMNGVVNRQAKSFYKSEKGPKFAEKCEIY